jgi:hypothetical protein
MVIPQGLSARSRRVWREVTEENELSADAALVFEAVLRTWDDLAQFEKAAAEVIEAGEMFHETNTGLVKAHPVFEEIRRHRALLERHAAALNLPLPDDLGIKRAQKTRSAASAHAQKAAQARWGRGHTAS